MNKTIFEGGSLPKTQSVEAVTAMLRALNRPVEPLPAMVELAGDRAVLIRSKKGDCYYVTTPNGCSCPSATYRPGQACKHQTKHFPAPAIEEVEEDLGDIGDFRPIFKYREPLAVV